jgi:tRNA modification GTPase
VSAPPAVRARELTPRGPGGVAVVEVSGPGARAAVEALAGARLSAGALRLVRLALDGEVLDEALAWCEDDQRVELHLHGSPPLVRRILEHLGAAGGAVPASIEERARELLASAPCEAGARMLLDQAEGALRRELASWRGLDDAALEARIAVLRERSRVARFALEPARVVLAGPVNAGKSTLFNALYGRERVVVAAGAGTTRDAIAERVLLGAWPVELVDTAGERELDPSSAPARIEAQGQRLARELRASADLVLWLDPCDRPRGAPARDGRAVVLASRADLAVSPPAAGVPRISAVRDPLAATHVVREAFLRAFELPEQPWRAGEALAFDGPARALLEAVAEDVAAGRAGSARGRAAAALDQGLAARAPIP